MNMNKKLFIYFIILFLLLIPVVTVNANEMAYVGENFCEDTKTTLRFVGYLVMLLKILVPLILITISLFDYYKVVVSGKDDDMKKQTTTLIKRIIAGILVFFIPTILSVFFTLLDSWSSVANDYNTCATCLLNPTDCKIK